MVRKTHQKRNSVKYVGEERSKTRFWDVYWKGLFIGTLLLTPAQVVSHKKAGYLLSPSAVKYQRGAEGERKNATRKRKRIRDTERIKTTRLSRSSNPKGLTLIYAKVTRIEGTKGKQSAFPNQRFFHNFKRPYPSMYGTTDRKMLIIK